MPADAGKDSKTINATLNLRLPVPQFKGTGQSRTNLAVHHLMAAADSARRVAALETAHAGQPFGEFFNEIMWNVCGSVLFAVAAVEADVNEIFIDACVNFPSQDSDVINEVWRLLEMKTIIEKYDTALFLKTKRHLKKGDSIYQDADSLIRMRNLLVHFKPEWSHEKREHAKIERRLTGKFKLSPFLSQDAEFFPKRCMSHGCADWAVRTAFEFRQAFSIEAGIENRFIPYVKRLATK